MPKTTTPHSGAIATEADRLAELDAELARVREAVGSRTMLARAIDLHLARAAERVRASEQRLRALAGAGGAA